MQSRRVAPPFAALVLTAVLSACGGGGGSAPVSGPTTAPLPTGIALLTPANGAISASVAPSAADDLVLAQAATTPTQPSGGGALAQFAATVTDTAGTSGTSTARAAASLDAQRSARNAENRAADAADGLHERTFPPSELRAQMRGITAVAAQGGRSTRAARGTVGSQRQFKILTANIGNSGGCSGGTSAGTYICFTTITATLKAAGAHGNIWVDDTALGRAGEFTVSGEFDQIASKFDAYYATETTAFAPAFYPGIAPMSFSRQCDATGTPLPQTQFTPTDVSGSGGTSIDVVITDALAGTGEGGYYYGGNEVPQPVWDCLPAPRPVSNNTSMFVITGNFYSTGPNLQQFNESYWLNTDVPRSMSHELQHLLHYRYKVLRPQVQGLNPVFDDTFVEEGMSMLAEDLAADGVHIDTPRFSFSFLLEPSLFSLTSFTGYQPNPTSTATNPPYGWYSNTAGSYGQAYLFQRYLYDRFGQGEITSIYNSTASSVLAVAAAAGEPFPQLYREFAVAVSAQNTPVAGGVYAFGPAIVLRGNVDVPSRRTGALSTRHLTFGGPQPPEIFTNNVPTGTLLLGPGKSGDTFIIDGATLFLPASNGLSGSTMTVSAPTAQAYQGASVQGSLPTPPPSST